MRPLSSLRQLFAVALVATGLLAMAVLQPQQAFAEDRASIAELRDQIYENGWSFEVGDEFIGSRTPEELANLNGFVVPEDWEAEYKANLKIYPVDKDVLPTSLDWREDGGITPIRNQGACGACWAFAATAELEAHIKIKYGVTSNLSEQQIVSCNPYGADCDGGWATAAYFVMQNYGMVVESCSPYLAQSPPEAACLQDGIDKFGTITGYHTVANDVNQIKAALQNGPVCTGIDAGDAFEAYTGGCYDAPGYSINHLVLIVGYDDRGCDGDGFWIIKNSHGADYGDGGYIFVKYGAGNVGMYVTQLEYTPPPVQVNINTSLTDSLLIADHEVEINWITTGDAVPYVDLYLGVDNGCLEIPVGLDVPNTGSYMWTVENHSTDFGSLVIYPSGGGSDEGYGFIDGFIRILGHARRYVSTSGSNTAPFESPADAAWTMTDAINACTGLDTIMVTGGDYLGSVNVTKPVKILGGYNADFSVRDSELYPTRLQSGTTGVRFLGDTGSYHGGVDGVIFHDCVGGIASEPDNGTHGGGIFCYESSPTIIDCVFENNRAAYGSQVGYGGAVCVVRGNPTISNCEFTGNIGYRGGAVAVYGAGTTTIENATFTANSCSDSMAVYQGACFYVEEGDLVVTDSVVRNNGGSGSGGAAALINGNINFSRVAVENNRALLDGGAFYTMGGELTLANLNVSGNSSVTGNGGGIASTNGAMDIKNVHFTGNTAANFGGSVYGMTVSGVFENNLFEGNSAATCGGLVLMGEAPIMVRNNIITGNSVGGAFISGSAITNDYNCVVDNIGVDYMVGTPGAHDVFLSPLFTDSGNGDFALAVYSPCIDAGDIDAACVDPDASRGDIGLLGGPAADFVAPAAVAGAVLADIGGGDIRLSWEANSEPGISHYVVYRDTAEVFIPSAGKAVGTVDHPETSFVNAPADEGTYYLVVAVDDMSHSGGYSVRMEASGGTTPAGDDAMPTALAFGGVVPNPFNPMTKISFEVPNAGRVQVVIYDVRGRMVRNLVDGHVEAGYHKATWDGRDDRGQSSAAGVYFARIANGRNSDTVKMVLAK